MSYQGWGKYVPVATRRAQAQKKVNQLKKKGKKIYPVVIEGKVIAKTFWGKGWCEHLEQFSDFANRLPRGRTYARNGSVCHLDIKKGEVEAIVSGSSLYHIHIKIKPFAQHKWDKIQKQCAGKIGSILELLQGQLSDGVMKVVTDAQNGLFPHPSEIDLGCDCPDWATMCKHVAAVLYGIGARLDEHPELLFLLRGVDHADLITDLTIPTKPDNRRKIKGDLTNLFGIELDETSKPNTTKPTPKTTQSKSIRPTGKTIIRLRKRFAMNTAQFSRLLGVSPPTITNWEKKTERLNLKPTNLASLSRTTELSKDQAWTQLSLIDKPGTA